MRILVTVPAQTQRLHHLTPLGWALRTAGHDVKISSRADFAGEIDLTGQVSVLLDAVGELTGFARVWGPDLVIWDQQADVGTAVAKELGVPGIRLRGLHDAPGGAGLTVDTTPASLGAAPDVMPLRPVPYTGALVIPDWMRRKPIRRQVVVALNRPSDRSDEILQAVGALDAQVICRIPGLAENVALPGNVRVLPSLPVATLAATAAAVVHDGEAANAAMINGVPHLDVTTETSLAEPVRRLLDDPDVLERARQLREEIAAMPSPRDLVPALIALGSD